MTTESVSVLIFDKNLKDFGVLANTGFVLGLTAGRLMGDDTFGPDVFDGDGEQHLYLTRIGHIVRKAGQSKLRSLRAHFAALDGVSVIDYTEDAAPSSYSAYEEALGSHSGEEIVYRAIHLFGPFELIAPQTKNLSKL